VFDFRINVEQKINFTNTIKGVNEWKEDHIVARKSRSGVQKRDSQVQNLEALSKGLVFRYSWVIGGQN
jgi:hypothetical protein